MSLYEAIRNHDSNEVEKCLAAGESLFEKNTLTGLSPFELACLIGDSGVRNVVFYNLHGSKGVKVEKKGKKRG